MVSHACKNKPLTDEQKKRHKESLKKLRKSSVEEIMEIYDWLSSSYRTGNEIIRKSKEYDLGKNAVYAIRDGNHWIYKENKNLKPIRRKDDE